MVNSNSKLNECESDCESDCESAPVNLNLNSVSLLILVHMDKADFIIPQVNFFCISQSSWREII